MSKFMGKEIMISETVNVSLLYSELVKPGLKKGEQKFCFKLFILYWIVLTNKQRWDRGTAEDLSCTRTCIHSPPDSKGIRILERFSAELKEQMDEWL